MKTKDFFSLHHRVQVHSIIATLIILAFLAAGCASGGAAIIPALPPTAAPVESTATTEITQIPTTSEFNASNPLPMYKISGTSTLKQEDLQPELDITTNAEQQMRDAGFGGQLDLVVKFIYKYLNLDTSINEHTFQTVYALNPYSDPPGADDTCREPGQPAIP